MKTKLISISIIGLAAAGMLACNPMDLESTTKVSTDKMFSTPDGINVVMSNLYGRLPIEEFGFNPNGYGRGATNDNGFHLDQMTDNAVNSQAWRFPQGSNKSSYMAYWADGWKLNRDINYLIDFLDNSSVENARSLKGECLYLRAFNYFEMAKRYGGLPIIDEYVPYTPGTDSLTLKVPRSTEEATYDFILADLDSAAVCLPDNRTGSEERRASKYSVLAFKSRVALYAASLATFNSTIHVDGPAVSLKMVLMSGGDIASKYYVACENAAEDVMNSGYYALFKPTPSNPEEAKQNIESYFQDPSTSHEESIILRGYKEAAGAGHSADFWYGPNQTSDGAPHPGRMNPSLDYANFFETYSNPGESVAVQNRLDGSTARENYSASRTNYIHHEKVSDFYSDKDARFLATVILPGEVWKGKTIIIQSGFIRPDGSKSQNGANEVYEYKGKKYYTYGGATNSDYSGFNVGSGNGNMTRTGLSFKKFLKNGTVAGNSAFGYSYQDWAELRYAEVLLNYAEAVLENDSDDVTKMELATKCFNATRRRAGHTTSIELNRDNLRRERRAEFSFENKRWWDLIRWRQMHKVMDHYTAGSLSPMLDLRTDPPSYILVRENVQSVQTYTFSEQQYYLAIPNTGSNGCTQNPAY